MTTDKLTAETITDDQIHRARRGRIISAETYLTAIWGSWSRTAARQRCADAINAAGAQVSS